MTALALMAALLAAAEVAPAAAAEAPLPAGPGFTVAPAPEVRSETVPGARKRPERGPWLELDAGPSWLHHSGVRGLESGPQVRFSLGTSLTDRVAAELWLAGSLQSSAKAQLGDEGAAGGGLGARVLLHQLDAAGRLQLFGHAGAGYMAATTRGAPQGAAGFAGALLLLQPPVKRFAFGLEVDATAVGSAFGFAVLPTLRCGI